MDLEIGFGINLEIEFGIDLLFLEGKCGSIVIMRVCIVFGVFGNLADKSRDALLLTFLDACPFVNRIRLSTSSDCRTATLLRFSFDVPVSSSDKVSRSRSFNVFSARVESG